AAPRCIIFRGTDGSLVHQHPPLRWRSFIQPKVNMKITSRLSVLALLVLLGAGAAYAGEYEETIDLFRHAGESAVFFNQCYGYAVFPTVGAGGLVVGGARGKGRVYVHDRVVGDTTMTQLSVGLQAGGKAYSQIIFFEN